MDSWGLDDNIKEKEERIEQIVKVETNKQEFVFQHVWLILPF